MDPLARNTLAAAVPPVSKFRGQYIYLQISMASGIEIGHSTRRSGPELRVDDLEGAQVQYTVHFNQVGGARWDML